MARRKRGGARGAGGNGNGRRKLAVAEPTPISASESEESCSSNHAQQVTAPAPIEQAVTAAAIHKKFGKFRCLHLDDTQKVLPSSADASDNEVAIEIVDPVSNPAVQSSEDGQSPIIITEEEVVNDVTTSSEVVVEETIIEEGLVEEECVCDDMSRIALAEEFEGTQEDEPMVTEESPPISDDVTVITVDENSHENSTMMTDDPVITEDTIVFQEEEETNPDSETPIIISSTDTTNDSVKDTIEEVATGIEVDVHVRRSSRLKTMSESRLVKTTKGRGVVVQTKAMLKQGGGVSSSQPASPSPVKVKQRWRRSSELEAARGSDPGQEQCDEEMEERLRQFVQIKENIYLTERLTSKETKRMTCDCFLTREEVERGELGCGDDCLNRLLMIECGNWCVVGERCTNKRFQQQRYHPVDVFRTERKGFGIRALAPIAGGDFIMEYVGEVINQAEFEGRAEVYSADKNRHYYFMSLRADAVIDATQKGNVSRFINHSCEPNSETQKWTVNGELRIGFFARRDIAPLEEITFDYQFQRYGKEAQKCFCEAELCRGWIGEEPTSDASGSSASDASATPSDAEASEPDADDEEDEKRREPTSKEESSTVVKSKKVGRPRTQVRSRGAQRRGVASRHHRTDIRDDADLDVEIEKLCMTGIKNRAHTLTLSRLLVRACDSHHKAPRLLRLLKEAELPCRRLFLDYHGLRLLHTWMTHDGADQTFKVLLLETLATLPISNKTILEDSKVLATVQQWSENTEVEVVPTLALKLLSEWSQLKEMFRIPKKERIEQMKEHEREADGGVQPQPQDTVSTYDRYRGSTSSTTSSSNGNRSKPSGGRSGAGDDTPPGVGNRKGPIGGFSLGAPPGAKLTKQQRRHLFAMRVAQAEEEKRRNAQAEAWRNHEQRCLALGIDPRQPFIPTPVWIPPPHNAPPPPPPPLPPLPAIKLPPKWKCVRDARGRPYYYHIKIRISQWEPPTMPSDSSTAPAETTIQEEIIETSSSSSEEESSSLSETSSSDEDDDDIRSGDILSQNSPADDDLELDDTRLMLEVRNKLRMSNPEGLSLSSPSGPVVTEKRERKREALVQEIIISPRREEDKLLSRMEARRYRATKEKLRRRKAQAARVDQEPLSSDQEQKIKNNFRRRMALVMVQILGPYKRADCTHGRITNTDDFKHLAKKLTMFVMLKELKNCRSVADLAVNDSVRTKAREFVKKYMSKYGEVYVRAREEMREDASTADIADTSL